MKQGWERNKLGDICGFVRGPFGGSLKKSNFKPDGYAVYEQQHAIYDQFEKIRYFIDDDKFNEMKRFELNPGDLIMSCSGTMGKIAIVPENVKKGIINQALLKLSPSKKVSSIFLKLWMQSESFQNSLKEYAGGAAIQNIASVAILKNIEISLPPLPEQQRIVAILDECFAAIAKAKANAEQNLKNAKELFESYLQSVFENKGEGWEEKKINEVCELKSGTTISPFLERNTGDVLYTKVADMNLPENAVEIHTSSRFVSSCEIKKNQIIPKGAVIFPKRGGAIATNKKRKIIKPTIVDLNTMAIIPGKKINKDYFFHWFQLFDLNDISNGANIPQINNYSFDEVYIPYPISLNEQQAIVHKLNAISAETNKLEAIYQQKIKDLEELKKSILQKAFSGDLRTEEAVL